jgi:serine/threonine protein kinase
LLKKQLGCGSQATVSLYRKKLSKQGTKLVQVMQEAAASSGELNPYYAVKQYTLSLEPNDLHNPHSVLQELKFMRELSHCENIAGVEEAYSSPGKRAGEKSLNFVMRFAAHGTLERLMKDYKRNTEDTLRDVISQLLLAADLMHRKKIIHRDIKPDNVLVTCIKKMKVQIADFGFSCRMDDI